MRDALMEQEIAEITEVISLFSPSALEVKAVEIVLSIHQAQLLSYLKLLDIPLGLIINSHALKLTEGVSRLILFGANQE